ncbi:hypothetical protein [Bradyrhizobium sp. WSM1417]|uniref:hypothetical protein n=1 Tax=Bradyrhizobium sp. WSM1417 TaxID=754500 RepID=UPI0004B8D051|nr:hypothetical protein [Bradyrhizobium sp. WSM1417]
MLSQNKQFLLGTMLSLLVSSANAGHVQTWLESKGGCQPGSLMLLGGYIRPGDRGFLGKAAEAWTDEDVEEYRSVVLACARRYPYGVSTPQTVDSKVADLVARLKRNLIEPARAQLNSAKEAADARRKLAEAQASREQAEMEAQAEREKQAAVEAQRLSDERALQDRKRQETQASREQARLEAQAKREKEDAAEARRLADERALQERGRVEERSRLDREAAEEALRRAEDEAPKLARLRREADEARRARQEAEQKLADIRSQLAAQEAVRNQDLAAAAAAESSRKLQTPAPPKAKQEVPSSTAAEQEKRSNDMPDSERQFIAAVQRAREVYRAATNDMARGAARPLRAKDLCSILRPLTARNWVGQVTMLSTNSDGKGVLEILIEKDIVVKTWNNVLADTGDETLIDPASSLFSTASALTVGSRVLFSGSFRPSSVDCVKEGSLTMRGSLTAPEFIIRFSDVSPVPD